jgi:predicted pyridoxine 5'-phosphate oxidase superfamily flavin-nucleotide-binding protein
MMAKLTQEMKDIIAAQQCFVATVNEDGTPNVGPKRSTRVLDDEHLAFNEVTAKHTWDNVQRCSQVAISVVDRERMRGFRFLGPAEVFTSGPLYDEAVAGMQRAGITRPLKGVVKVKVDKIFNLGFPGAGEEVAEG